MQQLRSLERSFVTDNHECTPILLALSLFFYFLRRSNLRNEYLDRPKRRLTSDVALICSL